MVDRHDAVFGGKQLADFIMLNLGLGLLITLLTAAVLVVLDAFSRDRARVGGEGKPPDQNIG